MHLVQANHNISLYQTWRYKSLSLVKKVGLVFGLILLFCHASAQRIIDSLPNPVDVQSSSQPYFYQGLTYGSQRNFNPITVLLNRGFEMLRITEQSARYSPFVPSYKFKNIVKNLANPIQGVQQYGTKEFFLEQVIPFGDPRRPYWFPNYALHMLEGGVTYTGLKEWFELHDAKYPKTYSAAIILSAALINESVEEKVTNGNFRLNVDAVADFWIFDVGGILLFQSKKVNKFMSQTLHMRDWSKQPAVYLPTLNLANCGQFLSLKWNLPKLKNVSFFSLVGLGGMGGLSYQFKNNTSLSMGIGHGPRRKESNILGLPIDVHLVPMLGIYYDKNNSLLASLELSNSKNDLYHNYFAELNLYPGFIKVKKLDPTVWLTIARDGDFLIGLGCKYTYGVGLGLR